MIKNKNTERFARIDLDRPRFEKECNQCECYIRCIIYNVQVQLVFQQPLQMASRHPHLEPTLSQRPPYTRLQDLWALVARLQNIYIRLVAPYHQLLLHETGSGLNHTQTAMATGLIQLAFEDLS